MIVLDSKRIMQKLQDEWNAVVRAGFSPDRIIGVFLYGAQNYNLAKDTSDVDSYAIVIPTFEDFCLHPAPISKQYKMTDISNDYHIIIKDIRLMYEMFLKQNVNFMEVLYTKYFILNPQYADLFNYYFVDNRDIISHYDRQQTVVTTCNQILGILKVDSTNRKRLANAWRLLVFIKNYIEDRPYADCIQLQGQSQEDIWNLKFNTLNLTTQEKIEFSQHLEKITLDLLNKYKEINSPMHLQAGTFLQQGTLELTKYSFKDTLIWNATAKNDFLSYLSNEEKQAYQAIIEQTQGCGVISISTLVETTGLKPKYFQRLLSKLKQYQIAKVTSLGGHGTYIEITQPELLAEAKQA